MTVPDPIITPPGDMHCDFCGGTGRFAPTGECPNCGGTGVQPRKPSRRLHEPMHFDFTETVIRREDDEP